MTYILFGILWCCGLFTPTHMHDTVPKELWPLTEMTNNREVMMGVNSASLINPAIPAFTSRVEPKLGYNALKLNGPSYVNISLTEELAVEKFMLMGMFYVNLKQKSYFFKYDVMSSLVFSVYTDRCDIHVHTPLNNDKWQVDLDDCENQSKWYTVAVRWNNGKMMIIVVWADPNSEDEKGDTVIEFEAKDLFPDDDFLPWGGTLYVGGPGVNGPADFAVCCLRIYDEEFGNGHIEEQMWQDCQQDAHWDLATPNPCGTRPCKNGGTCYVDTSNYICSCRPWFTGDTCETEMWMAHQGFKFISRGDVYGRLTPMTDSLNITVVGQRECASLCLKNNYCLSFTLHDNLKCTLYGDYTLPEDHNPLCRYYIVTSHGNQLTYS